MTVTKTCEQRREGNAGTQQDQQIRVHRKQKSHGSGVPGLLGKVGEGMYRRSELISYHEGTGRKDAIYFLVNQIRRGNRRRDEDERGNASESDQEGTVVTG